MSEDREDIFKRITESIVAELENGIHPCQVRTVLASQVPVSMVG